MTVIHLLGRIKTFLRNTYSELVCPQTCAICGEASKQGISICKNCIQNFLRKNMNLIISEPEQFCQICGQRLISETKICRQCKDRINSEEERYYDKVYTLFPYLGDGHKLVSEWKSVGLRGYSQLFAMLAVEFISMAPELQNTVIIPVPARPKKIRQKGWDQIDDLANSLKMFPEVKICKWLKRYDSLPQKSVSQSLRKSNLEGKFYVPKKNAGKIPERAVLIDDVRTTGSTISECAKTLKQHNCKTVYGLCLFSD
ncbi:MAG: amidophosphoribosyltransferase [Treponema sp.]|nr:MAG: amidophosphoribosyltransferase [Treponema sp.]